MNVLIAAATAAEMQGVKDLLEKQHFLPNQLELNALVTGIGGIATTYNLTKSLDGKKPGFIIQMGIAGSFDVEFPIGSVVCVSEELIGDMGAEENNEFRDLFDLGLMKENDVPFDGKILRNPFAIGNIRHELPLVRSIGISEITTRKERIELLKHKFKPHIESMEGAAFHYVCLKEKIPFLQVRAVSNYVGERNKENWNINLAIGNLNKATIEVLYLLQKNIILDSEL
jgi:futalosine hydrolase